MGEKPFVFDIYRPIIFTLLPKEYLNSLSYEYYQKLFFRFTFFYMHQSLPFVCTSKKPRWSATSDDGI